MPFYRARYTRDRLLPHPGPPGAVYASPSLSFKAQFIPLQDECIEQTARQNVKTLFSLYDTVTFSEFQWDSLMSVRTAEKFGADVSKLKKGFERIWRFPDSGPYNVESLECDLVCGQYFHGTIEILSNPRYPNNEPSSPSKPQEIEFFAHDSVPDNYICLGWSFILDHFFLPFERTRHRIPEFILQANRKEFCYPDGGNSGELVESLG